MRVHTRIFNLLLGCLLISACATAPTYRANPRLSEKLETTKKIMVIPLKTDVYQITAGGVQEKIDEWCSQCKENVLKAVQDELNRKKLILVEPREESLLSEDQKSDLQETRALFDAVNYSIIVHTYGPPQQLFPDKVKNFDYSLGPEIKALFPETDALLVISCRDEIATSGRKALQMGSVILGALVGIQVTPVFGLTSVSIALVDANTGAILWFKYHGSRGDQDLRNPTSTTTLIKNLLKDLPL